MPNTFYTSCLQQMHACLGVANYTRATLHSRKPAFTHQLPVSPYRAAKARDLEDCASYSIMNKAKLLKTRCLRSSGAIRSQPPSAV